MRIDVYNDIMKDSDGTDIWRHIENSTENFTPFQRLAWARSWLTSYNDVSNTFILVARDANNALVLPLMAHDGALRTLCYNAADITGSIFTGDTSSISACIAEYLVSETKYNTKLLWNILPSDPLVKALKRTNHLEFVEGVLGHSLDIASIGKDPTGWLHSSETRKQANRDLRRLVRDGATLRHRVSPKDVNLDTLMDIHDRE
ncbi:GNAT family N-acetyltransferase [Solidesulfovibrio fructosivorans]|nr:hypothetical protein [Solidesulfovibrio fructosivorans]